MSAAPGRDTRSHHTRLGWWVMTHERGGAALIGITAAAIVSADLIYTALRLRGSLREWFLVGFAFAVGGVLLEPLGRLLPEVGDDRTAARRRQQTSNVLDAALLLALVSLTIFGDGNWVGVLLGLVAALAGLFLAACPYWLLRPRPP
jgi:hypothetical protein